MPTLKTSLQKILRRMGVYQRLKASHLYDLYWRVSNRSVIEDRRREVDFYRDLLRGFRPGDLIFDIGANHGSKTSVFLALGARVVAVEPDQANQQVLREMFKKYRLVPKPVVIVGKAVSDLSGVETMWIDEPGSAKNTLSGKWVESLRTDADRFGHKLAFAGRKEVETTTLESLIATYGAPFFVKIDVEGYEPCVLRGLRRPVPFLSFEVNLPEFRQEGLQCIELLGFQVPDGVFNYSVDCRRGLALEKWLAREEFSGVFELCTDKSIEVFWSTALRAER